MMSPWNPMSSMRSASSKIRHVSSDRSTYPNVRVGKESTRCGNDDIRSLCQRFLLSRKIVSRPPAVDGQARDFRVVGQTLRPLGQFAAPTRGSALQSRALILPLSGVSKMRSIVGKRKAPVFPVPCLGDAHEVLSIQNLWNGFSLNRCCLLKSHRLQRVHDVWVHIQCIETDAFIIIFHGLKVTLLQLMHPLCCCILITNAVHGISTTD